MCGVAGAVGVIDSQVLSSVGKMSDAQRHRGPDGEGSWNAGPGDFSVAMAHRRLAIIDLSPDAAQPMREPQSGAVVCFNGEIYNYQELRSQLQSLGVKFRSQSDTEVILHAYLKWGLASVERFRGIFAYALWDAQARQLHLVRDPMGIKPLYLAQRAGTLYFASEVRSLLAGGHPRRLDIEGLCSFAWHGFVRGPGTIIDGIGLLEAGSTLTLSAGQPAQLRRYWKLPQAKPGTVTEAQLGHELRQTVGMQLVSDVPLGIFLSGGVDSSAVAALACEAGRGEVRTFNIGFDEASLDESEFAAQVASQLGTRHQSLRITAADFEQALPAALASLDQPTFDALNTYLVSKAVRDAGMTVALAGTGGDELFGGYATFSDLPRAQRMPHLRPVGKAAHAIASVLTEGALRINRVPPQTRWGKLADVLNSSDLVSLYQSSYALFSSELYQQLTLGVASAFPNGLSSRQRQTLNGLSDGPTLHAISNLEMASFIGERLLRDTDAASMATSLEARVPLLDHRLIETVAGLDERERFFPLREKRALRRAALGRLDPKIFDRPKSGFVLPIEAWCRRQLRSTMDQVFAEEGRFSSVGLNPKVARALWSSFAAEQPGIYWSRVWALFILVDWCGRNRVSL